MRLHPKNSQAGNLAIIIIVSVLVSALAIPILIAIKSYSKRAITDKKKQLALSQNLFLLEIISKAMTPNKNTSTFTKPFFYPEPYTLNPTLNEIPVVQVTRASGISNTFWNKHLSSSANLYTVDETGTAAFRKPASANQPVTATLAYFISSNLSKINRTDLATFFRVPSSTWPKDPIESSNLNYIDVEKVYFKRFNRRQDTPQLIDSVDLVLTNGQSASELTTYANVKVAPPPDPDCKIALAVNIVPPLKIGNQVSFSVETNSIVSAIKFYPSEYANPIDMSVQQSQSIRDLGTYKSVSNPVTITVPKNIANPNDTSLQFNWRLKAIVSGPSQKESKSCTMDVAVANSSVTTLPSTCGCCGLTMRCFTNRAPVCQAATNSACAAYCAPCLGRSWSPVTGWGPPAANWSQLCDWNFCTPGN